MKSNYTNLDLLRSLAVLSVVAAHMRIECVQFHVCSENLAVRSFMHNLSITGVMFFFVHTCLVLMLSMHRAPDLDRGRNFLVRRAFRIYPLCWAGILLVLATGLNGEGYNSPQSFGLGVIASNFLLVQNILPIHGGVSILGPTWSLAWEVQMYLVLPFFFAFLKRFARLYVVFAIWGGATLLAIAASMPQTAHAHLHGAVYPPMFIAGMVAYKLLERRSVKPPSEGIHAWTWPFFVLGLFLLQASVMHDDWYWTPHGAIIDSSICLALALAVPVFEELRARWIVLPAQQIAKYSYGIYLLHAPAIIFVFSYLSGLPLALKIAASLALTTILSFVSFHTIENPLILLGKRLTQPALGIAKATSRTAIENSSAGQTTPAAQLAPGDTRGIEGQTLAE
jgi:peptidoglycan/LPS O-acetylase OafA/YrhL